jgi:D-alanyl-D-alanine carboxypeptidase/D-alanyl-D-alanine-endopeptidase (penicillin-binding protein 4)
MLLKRLGRERGDEGSWRAGTAVERRFLIDSVGLDSTQFLLHDGSGLSAKDAVSPLVFVRLLDYLRRRPEFEDFAAGLPRSGEVGSLRNRFLATPLEGRVRAKTGSIGQVNTLSGFIGRDDPGAPPCRIFSIQANHHGLGGRAMIAAIDSLVVAIGRSTPCSRPARRRSGTTGLILGSSSTPERP